MTFQYADDLYCLFDTCPDVLSSHMEEYRVSGEIIDDDPNHYASPESLQGSCAGKMSPMDHSDKLFNTSGPVFIKLEINENADRIVSVKSDEASVDLSPKVYAESCANYTSDSSVDSSVGSSVKSTDTSDTSVTHLSPVGGVGLGDVIIKIQRPFDTFGAKTSFDVTAWDRTIKVRFNSWELWWRNRLLRKQQATPNGIFCAELRLSASGSSIVITLLIIVHDIIFNSYMQCVCSV